MSQPARPPRRHHFIPEFYQRQWCGADHKVERYARVNGEVHRRRVYPSEAAFENDLYRHPRRSMDEWGAQALELKVFSPIDDAAAKALDAMIADPLALRDNLVRRAWTLFLRTMLMRTPYQMAGTLASFERIWRETGSELEERYAGIRQPDMPPTLTEFLEQLNPNEAKENAFRMYAESLSDDRLTRHIRKLPWRIFDCAEADHRLLLSDHPVVLVPLERDDGHIAMALSPTKYLVAAPSDRMRAAADSIAPKLAVRILNKLAVQRAQHYVISADQSQDAFIRKHFGTEPVPPFFGAE